MTTAAYVMEYGKLVPVELVKETPKVFTLRHKGVRDDYYTRSYTKRGLDAVNSAKGGAA